MIKIHRMICVLLQKGFISSENETVFPFFEQDYVYFENWNPVKNSITIKHLLNMASGLDCNDDNPFSEGQEDLMYSHRDWYKYILDTRLYETPGEKFYYCTGGVNLLGGIIRRTTKKNLTEFAEQTFFSKLGISNYRWSYAPDGSEDTGGHLYLPPRDLLKMGVLFLNKGNWNGDQIINTQWMETSREKVFPFYGYLWWKQSTTLDSHIDTPTIDYIYASGNGGQNIFVIPAQNAVIVTTASNFDNHQGGSSQLFREQGLSAIYTN